MTYANLFSIKRQLCLWHRRAVARRHEDLGGGVFVNGQGWCRGIKYLD